MGTENTRTGTIKPATLTIPPQPQSNTGTKETIKIYESSAHSAVASLTPAGDLTITDTVMIEADITTAPHTEVHHRQPRAPPLAVDSAVQRHDAIGRRGRPDIQHPVVHQRQRDELRAGGGHTDQAVLGCRRHESLRSTSTAASVRPAPRDDNHHRPTGTPPAPVLAGTTTVTLTAKIAGHGATPARPQDRRAR